MTGVTASPRSSCGCAALRADLSQGSEITAGLELGPNPLDAVRVFDRLALVCLITELVKVAFPHDVRIEPQVAGNAMEPQRDLSAEPEGWWRAAQNESTDNTLLRTKAWRLCKARPELS